jgi:hypothetical protein
MDRRALFRLPVSRRTRWNTKKATSVPICRAERRLKTKSLRDKIFGNIPLPGTNFEADSVRCQIGRRGRQARIPIDNLAAKIEREFAVRPPSEGARNGRRRGRPAVALADTENESLRVDSGPRVGSV